MSTSQKSTELLTSPKGEIQFLALANPVSKVPGAEDNKVYTVRLKFDSSTKEGAAWKKTVESINPNIVGTKHTNTKTEYTVRATSKYQPKVTDAKGNELEEMPMFFSDSSGTAKIIIQPYYGNKMGGAINLVAVVICDLDAGTPASSREDRLAQLKAALQDATDN